MAHLEVPPVLSTPATYDFGELRQVPSKGSQARLSDEQLHITYEIERTISEIRKQKFVKLALQFPDSMLPDAPRVFEALSRGLNGKSRRSEKVTSRNDAKSLAEQSADVDPSSDELLPVRLYILADTSYGACCVDEIAAEHVNADAVVHYGRACLSPTARIPVVHIFTIQPLLHKAQLIEDFKSFYQNTEQRIILMADVTYQKHLQSIYDILQSHGYVNLFTAEILHDPSSPLPNRSIPTEVTDDPALLREWHLFHVADPLDSLLLTLASRVASIRIFPTSSTEQHSPREPFLASTSRTLNRRYAVLTSMNAVSIFGILINTLSVKNYLHIVEHVKSRILAAGKKSYTFVVGKINAAKVANFSEIGAWVVVGCWESSLIDSKDFWKPIITPFELELGLKGDDERVWTGEWNSDFQKILHELSRQQDHRNLTGTNGESKDSKDGNIRQDDELDSEEESAPPEFDLRTGRYISHSRPMRQSAESGPRAASVSGSRGTVLTKRAKGDLASIGGDMSPGAEYLRSKKTWTGLGSDFEIACEDAGSVVEQGRSGIARGYTHGQAEVRT